MSDPRAPETAAISNKRKLKEARISSSERDQQRVELVSKLSMSPLPNR
jgi:hypothetical protein